MELNPIGVFAILGGLVLIYSGVKNIYPQDVIRAAFGKPALKGPIQADITGHGRTLNNTNTTVANPDGNNGLVIATV